VRSLSRGLVALATASCGRVGFDAAPPSCIDLAPACGSGRATSCCVGNAVPGGTFLRSYDVASDNAFPDTSSPATVSDFVLDAYEVTVGRFRRFVAVGAATQAGPPPPGAGAHARIANSGWNASWTASLAMDPTALAAALGCSASATWTAAPGANETLPINCTTWFDAFAFCAWDGGFLPSEAEWNYAASGGGEQRAYPWSVPPSSLVISCTDANYAGPCPPGATDAVGSRSPTGDARWGHADLAGNVGEWVLDSNVAYTTPCGDCATVDSQASKIVRGFAFHDGAGLMRAAERLGFPATTRHDGFGFRCARAP
jgi:formylglycine-generating enzyme required for sulfatase activity